MIIVRVELLSARTGERTELARMHICNSGGTETIANYKTRTLRGRSTESLNRNVIQREGAVRGHNRHGLHVWHLVTKALVAMGYGQ